VPCFAVTNHMEVSYTLLSNPESSQPSRPRRLTPLTLQPPDAASPVKRFLLRAASRGGMDPSCPTVLLEHPVLPVRGEMV
jgi:hypothetical protein